MGSIDGKEVEVGLDGNILYVYKKSQTDKILSC